MTTEQKIRLLQTLVLNGLGDTTTRLHAARRPCLARFPHASPARVRDAGGSRRRKHIVPVEWRLAEAMRPLRCTVGRTSPETCASTLTGTPQYTRVGGKTTVWPLAEQSPCWQSCLPQARLRRML